MCNVKRLLVLAGVAVCVVIASLVWAGDNVTTVTAYLKVVSDNFDLARSVQNYTFAPDGVAMDYGIISLSVTATNTLPINNVTTPRYCYFRNKSTNDGIYVTLTMYLRSNDVAILPLADTNVAAYAATGTPELEYWFNQE